MAQQPPLQTSKAFSLVEVVIAIGVMAFALLGIFSLFSTSLRTNKDASAQQEGFEIQRIITSRLQDTNVYTVSSLGPLATNAYQGVTKPTFYIYSMTNTNTGSLYTILSSNNGLISTTNTSLGYPSNNLYVGNLYFAVISGSSNIPQNIFPYVFVQGGKANSFVVANWPAIPLHATVYAIPSTTMTNTNSAFFSNSAPVISFDFIIPK